MAIPIRTAFARSGAWHARLVLLVAALVTAGLIAIAFSPIAQSNYDPQRARPGDVELYQAEVSRIHAGENYHDVAAGELRQRGYPTASVFNWRTPLPMWLIAQMPDPAMGKALLCLLALATLGVGFEAIARDAHGRIGPAVLTIVLLSGPLLFCALAGLFVMPVLWAGVLIALSVACYGVERPGWGVAFGLAAIFVRELAMPYVAVCVVMAIWQRQPRELTAWIVGLAAFAVFYGLHAWVVMQRIGPTDIAHDEGWLQLGGAAFLLSTTQMNAYLLLLPQWVAALYLAAALLGLAGWDSPLGHRCALATSAFIVAFALIGQPFNQYWGSLTAPLICFGVARVPWTLRDLGRAALPRRVRQYAW